MNQPIVTGLYVYPVKSMKGIALKSAMLTPQGLGHDRRFMVVRASGRFLTQRDLPRLALLHTGLSGDGIELSMDGHGSVTVPFDCTDGDHIETRVWGDECLAIDQGFGV